MYFSRGANKASLPILCLSIFSILKLSRSWSPGSIYKDIDRLVCKIRPRISEKGRARAAVAKYSGISRRGDIDDRAVAIVRPDPVVLTSAAPRAVANDKIVRTANLDSPACAGKVASIGRVVAVDPVRVA